MTPNLKLQFPLVSRHIKKSAFLVSAILFAAVFTLPFKAFSGPLSFLFSSDLPERQRQTVLSDLEALNHLQFSDSNGRGARLFGAPLNSQNLKQWLSQRSRYIVSENFSYAESVKVVTPGFIYPNADILPYREVAPPPRPQGETQRMVTVMTNMGAHIYVQGKKAKNLLSADISGIGSIAITSPRIGLFKIGEGLFVPLLQNNNSNDYISFANSLRRLAVYFHEARHSDGNGKSLGFLHAPCPANKGSLAGFYACDRNQNGPYTIEGTFLRSAVDNCKDCNRREKEALRNIYADKFNRMVTTGTVTGAAAQRLITDSAAETCRNLRVLNVSASAAAACSSGSATGAAIGNAAAANTTETRPAWLDENPEGASK